MKWISAFLVLLTFPLTSLAQTSSDMGSTNETVAMLRTMAALEKKVVIADALELSRAEDTAFWPIYNQYSAEKGKINGRLIKVINDYAKTYDRMTDSVARSLVDDHMAVQQDLLKLRRKYLRKFDKALSPIKVARFYQIENKLDAIIAFDLATEIPVLQ